jgi:hypothetical protein
MNMSYCKFQNTAIDLADCLEDITEELSFEEHRARLRLVKLCKQVVEASENGDIPDNPED